MFGLARRSRGRTKTVRAVTVVPLVAVAVATTTSCSEDAVPRPAARDIEGLSVTVVQQRIDEGTRRIGIRVGTGPDMSLHVRGVQLESPAFEPVPTTDKDTEFTPRQSIDLTTTYGDPRCGENPVEGLAANVVVQDRDGERTVEVPVTGSGIGLVRRLHTSECASQALRRAAPVSYAGKFSRDAVAGVQVLIGALELRRPVAGGSRAVVVVDSLAGSVLFDFAVLRQPAPGPVARLEPSSDRLRLPVLIGSNGRCDQHARSQSTQTFLFSAYVRVDGSAQHREILVPPPALQRQALALLDDVC